MRKVKYGSLMARVTGGVDGHGGGNGPVVVFLHGFGAPGHDLVQLGAVLPVPGDVRFVFPEAPLSLGAMYGDGRAWWMLDVDALQRRARGEPVEYPGRPPEGMVNARTQVIGLLDAMAQDLHPPQHGLVLGGFSQGSMVCCDVALHDDRPLAGLVLLSSTLITRQAWEPRMKQRKGLRVFQSHGTQDPILGYDDAVRLRDLWRAAGADLTFVDFPGGHEIPPKVLSALAQFLTDATAEH